MFKWFLSAEKGDLPFAYAGKIPGQFIDRGMIHTEITSMNNGGETVIVANDFSVSIMPWIAVKNPKNGPIRHP